MRFGLTMISGVYGQHRIDIVDHCLSSLTKTNVDGLEEPIFQLTYHPTSFDYEKYMLKMPFESRLTPDPPEIQGGAMSQAVAAGYRLLDQSDITHLVFLWDDFVFNPQWLQQLNGLVQRHPDVRAWSVYRSRFTRHHNIIGGDGTDCLMSIHDGIGCVTRDEWLVYKNLHDGYDFSVGAFPGGGCTPDIHHAAARPGDRWATSRDYMENLGRHRGIEHLDCAIDFVGE